MKTMSLKAHYDGKHICLDEPFELRSNTKLMVVVLPESEPDQDEELEALYELGRQSLARAYGDDEPDYSDCIGKPAPAE